MIIFLQADPGLVRVVKIDHGLLFPAVEYLQECIIAENEAGTYSLVFPSFDKGTGCGVGGGGAS